MAENTEQAPAGGGKGKLKLIIGLVLIIILAVGLSVAGTLWFLKSDDGAAADEAAADETAEPAFQSSHYYAITKPFVVTLSTDGRQRYMQIFLALQSRNQGALDVAQANMPLIRSRLLTLFGGQDFQAMQTPEGKEKLLQETLDTINGILAEEGGEPIDHVLFENFVLQ
ncbi:flagellar basal body protein FliL [Marinobacter sp. R17]|uniref:flagellar basal body-associated FliL family protein n=1 Tax=Marinobacter sp. R17 TaxID=2484250 RepID=UPI000F4D0326|nr:flagellar basal body-associated FliL family protein [Marinobacter sp. R17]ROU01758.1 flagellar basal body protein FliL [Marinobacter sp. R17]